MAEVTEACIDDDGILACAICQQDCFKDHTMLVLGQVTIYVACPGCAREFRVEVQALIRELRRRREQQLLLKEGS